MSGRSSPHSLLLLAALAACKSTAKQPEADPALVKALAAKMAQNMPAPQAVRACQPKDYVGVPTLTYRTLLQLGDLPVKPDPEHADWINPLQLESPIVHDLTAADETTRRRAAAQMMSVPGWVIYKVDLVNAPMALGIKELKIGTIGARALRFGSNGFPECVEIFYFQNDQKVSDAAIAKSDRAIIDPAIAKTLRDDLAQQYLMHAPRAPAQPATK
jgi:hypothetical protein